MQRSIQQRSLQSASYPYALALLEKLTTLKQHKQPWISKLLLAFAALSQFACNTPSLADEVSRPTETGTAANAGVAAEVSVASEVSVAAEEYRAEEPSSPAEWFGQTIRSAPWRSPSDELAGFHLPAGFQAELVASEPDIAKPMNLAFDSKGRLWVSQSHLYPFPAQGDTAPSDSIALLEDRDRNRHRHGRRLSGPQLPPPAAASPPAPLRAL